MNAFEAFQIYTAVKLHFTSDYDYHRYHGSTKSASLNAFLARPDKVPFERFAAKIRDKQELVEILLANFSRGKKIGWIGDIDQNLHKEMMRNIESMEYQFRKDCNRLFSGCKTPSDFNDIFRSLDGMLPNLIQMMNRKEIAIETVAILFQLLRIHERISCTDPRWDTIRTRIAKYMSFLDFDRKFYKEILKEATSHIPKKETQA